MKAFLGTIKKEFLHLIRDTRTLVIIIAMPLLLLLLFGYAIRNDLNEVSVAVIDPGNHPETRAMISKLESSGYFNVEWVSQSPENIETWIQKGQVKAVLYLSGKPSKEKAREGTTKVELILDATEPNTSRMIAYYVEAILSDMVFQQLEEKGVNIRPTSIAAQRFLYNPELLSVHLFVPGIIAVILMLISALMTSITITKEKEMGTMEVLLVSPLRPAHLILGKVTPYLGLSLFNVVSILGISMLLFETPFRGNFFLFMVVSIVYMFTALALGIFISTLTSSQLTAMMISLVGLLLPTLILSGFIFPIKNMPLPLQYISNIIPAKWYLIIIRGIMLKGVGIESVVKETVILASMSLSLIGISILKFNVRLEK